MTRIHGPVQRQLHLIKHLAPKPARAIFFFPEQGMRNPMSGLPVPVIVVPESTRLIAASHDELEILPVCHLVLINLKRRNFHRVRFKFIVPTKAFAASSETQRHGASEDGDHSTEHWRTSETRRIDFPHLPVARHLMPHVSQRLRLTY